jgi:Ala-tRNA(Pro) deacylase
MIPENLRDYLESHQARYHVHTHEPRFTAQEIAHQAHVSGKCFAKTVLLRSDGRFLLTVLPANEEIDLENLGRKLGHPVELAGEEAFARLFPWCEVGAAPPIAALASEDLPVYADVCFLKGVSIAFNGGTHTDVVEMPWSEFERITTPTLLAYGRPPVAGQPAAHLIDLGPLLGLAFHSSDVLDATQGIEEARARFAAESKMDGFSYEVMVPTVPDADWVRDRLVRPLIYFCESRGAATPACPGVFVSLFTGRKLHCVLGSQVLAWASSELGVPTADLQTRYGLKEQDTALR